MDGGTLYTDHTATLDKSFEELKASTGFKATFYPIRLIFQSSQSGAKKALNKKRQARLRNNTSHFFTAVVFSIPPSFSHICFG